MMPRRGERGTCPLTPAEAALYLRTLRNCIGRVAVVGRRLGIALLAAGLVAPTLAQAEDPAIPLAIRNHRFEPAELPVPAGVKVRLLIKNLDATPEEFESHSLHREKVVPGGGEITVFVGPLDPGSYDFFGDFNPDTAQGHIVVK